ncbi:MAG: AI-2E family transporter [Myxococcota bacterium]
MASAAPERSREQRIQDATEIAIRIAVLGALLLLCLRIVLPFVGILLWAMVIAIGVSGPFEAAVARMGGRRGLAAGLFVTIGLLALIVPAVLLSETLVSGAQGFAQDMEDGRLHVPAPPASIAGWPLVGEPLHELWQLAHQSFEQALERLEPQLRAASLWLLSAAQSAGLAVLQLFASIAIAGVMLVHGSRRQQALERLGLRLGGAQGARLAELANATVGSVVQGIVGVAVVQSLLAAIGFWVVGLPAAGLWTTIVLVGAVVQLPVFLIMVPPVLIVFSTGSTFTAGVFAAWCVGVSLIDNVLKPIFFGRGAQVPTVVIFVGAIGGMLSMGILGLFIGAVLLTLGYEIVRAWIADGPDGEPEAAA